MKIYKAVLKHLPNKKIKNKLGETLRVNSDKVQNVGQGQNLDHLRTPLISTGWGHIVTVPNLGPKPLSPYFMLY